MSDLAKKAAKLIVESREDWDSENEALCDVQNHIEGVGTLVPPEDAALLEQVKRAFEHTRGFSIIRVDGRYAATVTNRDFSLTRRNAKSPHAALSSALDAAGVPS